MATHMRALTLAWLSAKTFFRFQTAGACHSENERIRRWGAGVRVHLSGTSDQRSERPLLKMRKTLAVVIALITYAAPFVFAGALEEYVQKSDRSYSWKQTGQFENGGFMVFHLEIQSQTWRSHPWTHHIQVVRPSEIRHPGKAFLFITGDGDGTGHIDMLSEIAKRAGIIAAVVTGAPRLS